MFPKWLLKCLKVRDGAEGQEKDTWLFFSCHCLEHLCAGRHISQCQANDKPLMDSCCNWIYLSLGIRL